MCYRHEWFKFPSGKFDDFIDCTYVMVLENSPREQSILKTLSEYTPTSNCIIQYNKGYKGCKKNLKYQLPNHDLVHALQTVFKHALASGCHRILVLEDDCTFDERINDHEIIEDIRNFVVTNDPKVYSLGHFFSVTNPFDTSAHKRTLVGLAAHCMIYNRQYMIEKHNEDFFGPAPDLEPSLHWDTFMYHRPIAYQTFPDTENSQKGWLVPGIKQFVDFVYFKPLGLTDRPQPGFDQSYVVSRLFSFLLVVWLIYVVLKTLDPK